MKSRLTTALLMLPLLAGLSAFTTKRGNTAATVVAGYSPTNKPGYDTLEPMAALKLLLNQPLIQQDSFASNEDGTEVLMKDARPCITVFEKKMKKRGISRKNPEAVSVKVGKTIKLTLWETFKGKNLVEWLVKIMKKYDPDGHGDIVGIKIVFGIYNDDYLRHVGNGTIDVTKQRRIAVFLVPYDLKGKRFYEDDNTPVYDFGGLQP